MKEVSSLIYGPSQVRDLSELWGKVKNTVANALNIASSTRCQRGRCCNVSCSGRSQSENVSIPSSINPLPQNVRVKGSHENLDSVWSNPPSSVLDLCSSPLRTQRKPDLLWKGALLHGVRGSIPSSVLWSKTSAPIYKAVKSSGKTQPRRNNCGLTK